MKTSTLTGSALRHAVMLAEGWTYFPATEYECSMYGLPGGARPVWTVEGPAYLTGSAGDDIIDRENISIMWMVDNSAEPWAGSLHCQDRSAFGATRREAALRAWVQHKLGDDVAIPESLK